MTSVADNYVSTGLGKLQSTQQDVLATLLPGKTSFPESPEYASFLTSYFVAQENEVRPLCIISPSSAGEVSIVLKLLAKLKIKFAVRGGGHNLNICANIADGVVINLRHLNSVFVKDDRSAVVIGGGAKWAEVYSYIDAIGLSTSGGRAAEVGVGGLSTGGGVSFFSGSQGLVCDNITAHEVVLSSGEIVQATSELNPGLHKALKGGSSNFGIVTSFTIRCFPQGPFYGGFVVTPISTLPAIHSAFMSVMDTFDPHTAVIISLSWKKERGYSIFSSLGYTKKDPNPIALQPFLALQPQYLNTMRMSTAPDILSSFASDLGKFTTDNLRHQFATTTFKSNAAVLQSVLDLWQSSVIGISHIPDINWSLSIQPWPGAFSTNPAGGSSQNVLGLDPSNGPMILALLSYSWSGFEYDTEATLAAQHLIAAIDAVVKKGGCAAKFRYLNYAASWQDPLASYGEESVEFLREVAERYDPEGVFQELCPGGFKIPKRYGS